MDQPTIHRKKTRKERKNTHRNTLHQHTKQIIPSTKCPRPQHNNTYPTNKKNNPPNASTTLQTSLPNPKPILKQQTGAKTQHSKCKGYTTTHPCKKPINKPPYTTKHQRQNTKDQSYAMQQSITYIYKTVAQNHKKNLVLQHTPQKKTIPQ